MKAQRTQKFPIFKMTDADECPECGSALVWMDTSNSVCPACAGRMVNELRLALKVVRQLNRKGFRIVAGSPFSNRVNMLLKGKFTSNKTRR
jgi:hypothetical protein